MRIMTNSRSGAVALACFVAMAPCVVSAAEQLDASGQASRQAAQTAVARDVSLMDHGTLHGQVVDVHGAPAGGAQITVRQGEHVVVSVQADASGRFSIRDLQGGVYQLQTDQGGGLYRLWAPGTAPPSAVQQLLVVDGNVIRGQYRGGLAGADSGQFGGMFMRLLHNPWFVGAGIATAIALPLALDDDDAS